MSSLPSPVLSNLKSVLDVINFTEFIQVEYHTSGGKDCFMGTLTRRASKDQSSES